MLEEERQRTSVTSATEPSWTIKQGFLVSIANVAGPYIRRARADPRHSTTLYPHFLSASCYRISAYTAPSGRSQVLRHPDERRSVSRKKIKNTKMGFPPENRHTLKPFLADIAKLFWYRPRLAKKLHR